MKYTICTVVNDIYLEFLYYFTKSALEKCPNMDQLIILYTGENFSQDPIFNNSRVKIAKYSTPIKTQNIWDSGWQQNIDLKTQFLRDLATKSNQPIFLVDVDCYFLKEFIDVVDTSKDILVTKRVHSSPYIASFVGLIKPDKCISFIDEWRNQMSLIKTIPKETTALVKTIPIMKDDIAIQEVPDTTISCINFQSPPPEARILHFKGTRIGDAVELVKKRLENLKSIV
jgi:hypothetical protein